MISDFPEMGEVMVQDFPRSVQCAWSKFALACRVNSIYSIEWLCEMFNVTLNSVIDSFTTLKAEGRLDPLNV